MDESLSLDHVGLVARDVEAASAAFERLGFNLTALSRHWGPVPARAGEHRWGTGNRCAMLARGYLEIMGVVDPGLYTNRLESVLQCREGCYVLAFRTGALEECRTRLVAGGFSPDPEGALARPLDDESAARVAFRLVRLPARDTPVGRVVFISHETPELMWRDEHLLHPNGAIALTALYLCVDEVAETAARYARLLGLPCPAIGGGTATLEFGIQRIEIMTPDAAASRFPGVDRSLAPYALGFAVAVADLVATGAFLDRNGVIGRKRVGKIIVSPSEAGGAVCEFVQAVLSRCEPAARDGADARSDGAATTTRRNR